MRERGAEPAERARNSVQHSHLLQARRNVHGLDAGRDELGTPGQRRETEIVAGERRQAREQILDVGLVARPLPAEHVGVDHDERSAHEAASRYTSAVRRAVSAQSNARARSRPARTSSSRRVAASSIPSAIDAGIERIDEHRCAACHLLGRTAARRDDRCAARHRLDDRDAEALLERRIGEAAGAAIEPGELLVRDSAEPAHAGPELDVSPACVTGHA